jgi:hypothetical protein
MRAMVMEIINTRKDRGLIVSEARRRALTEPAASTFVSLRRRPPCSVTGLRRSMWL